MKSRILAVAAAIALSLGLTASPAAADPVDDLLALIDPIGNNNICVRFSTYGIPTVSHPRTGDTIDGGCIWIKP